MISNKVITASASFRTIREVCKCENFRRTIRLLGLSPSGRYVVACTYDGCIFTWDLEAGTRRKKFRGHKAGVNGLDIAHTEDVIISGDADGQILKWDIQSQQILARLKFTERDRKIPPGPRRIDRRWIGGEGPSPWKKLPSEREETVLDRIRIDLEDEIVCIEHLPLGVVHTYYTYSGLSPFEGSANYLFREAPVENMKQVQYQESPNPPESARYQRLLPYRDVICSALDIIDRVLVVAYRGEAILDIVDLRYPEAICGKRVYLVQRDAPVRRHPFQNQDILEKYFVYNKRTPGPLWELYEPETTYLSPGQAGMNPVCRIKNIVGSHLSICSTRTGNLLLIDYQNDPVLFNIPAFSEEVEFIHFFRDRGIFLAGTKSGFGIWTYDLE